MWSSLFGGTKSPEAWVDLVSIEQLEEIEERSNEHPMAVFKHSTRCSRSAFAFEKLASAFEQGNKPIDLYYLDLLTYRKVSDEIATRWKIHHQSPQLIIVFKGAVAHHSSHEAIDLEKALQSISR